MTCLNCGAPGRIPGTPLCGSCFTVWRAGEAGWNGGSAGTVELPRRAVGSIQVQGQPMQRLVLQSARPIHLAQVFGHLAGAAHEAAGHTETVCGLWWER